MRYLLNDRKGGKPTQWYFNNNDQRNRKKGEHIKYLIREIQYKK